MLQILILRYKGNVLALVDSRFIIPKTPFVSRSRSGYKLNYTISEGWNERRNKPSYIENDCILFLFYRFQIFLFVIILWFYLFIYLLCSKVKKHNIHASVLVMYFHILEIFPRVRIINAKINHTFPTKRKQSIYWLNSVY